MAEAGWEKDEWLQWLRFVLDPSKPQPIISDWKTFYDFATQQAIIGICDPTRFDVRMPQDLLFRWIGDLQTVRAQNQLLNLRAAEVFSFLSETGFRCCILKGQGNAEMYPNPLSRTPGDIDIWIDTDEDTIQRFVRERFSDAKDCFKHIKFPVFDDVEVDVHQTPLKFRHPWHQSRLQRWINRHKDEQFANQIKLTGTDSIIHVPTAQFNAVYQLGHIMIHLFDEGIGFRHLIDYFYVLKRLDGISSKKRDEIVLAWKRLGMYRLASAVMWIESDILGLPGRYLLVSPDQSLGERLLADVLDGGNFGHYAKRRKYQSGCLVKWFYSLSRLLKLLPCFPGEAVFQILLKVKAAVKKKMISIHDE